jgi:hypothetical protein
MEQPRFVSPVIDGCIKQYDIHGMNQHASETKSNETYLKRTNHLIVNARNKRNGSKIVEYSSN